jgi:hypothetical protein
MRGRRRNRQRELEELGEPSPVRGRLTVPTGRCVKMRGGLSAGPLRGSARQVMISTQHVRSFFRRAVVTRPDVEPPKKGPDVPTLSTSPALTKLLRSLAMLLVSCGACVMRCILLFTVVVLVLLTSVSVTHAQVWETAVVEMSLEQGKIPSALTYARSFKQTKTGLVMVGDEQFSFTTAWIQTPTIAVGRAWRPPSSANLKLTAEGDDFQEVRQSLKVYVRYGCDAIHWSTWYRMQGNRSAAFTIDLELPQGAREKYYALWERWKRNDPDEPDQQHDLCCWIRKVDPRFFENEFPFLGYVQFRLERV